MASESNNPDVIYLASPGIIRDSLNSIARAKNTTDIYQLARRGYELGWVGLATGQQRKSVQQESADWQRSNVVFWPGKLVELLPGYAADIDNAYNLYLSVLDGAGCAEVVEASPCRTELNAKFNLVSCSYDESDLQQIERLDFEPAGAQSTEEQDSEVWMKASWLSYSEDDASLRFRFSFGLDGCEDVAADPYRQQLTSELAKIIFPESKIITENRILGGELEQLLDVDGIDFVERIVYFNAPDGGAQFHQDVERGHLGVIFAQLTGRTAWLALPKQQLIHEIITFLARDDALALLPKSLAKKHQTQLFKNRNDAAYLNQWLDQRDNDALDVFINQTPAFTRQLVNNGYAYILHPGDVLLLPQQSMDACAWHSVFCLDEEPGEALSFAMRKKDKK